MSCSSSASTSHSQLLPYGVEYSLHFVGVLRQSQPSIQMTLYITSSCVVLCPLNFLHQDISFRLLINTFHSITALCLNLFSNSQISPRRRPLQLCFVTPLHWQLSSTPNSPKPISTCVTSSSKDIQCAGASITSTTSICVRHMANKGMEFKRGLSWLDTPARDTQITIKKLQVRGMATRTQDMAQQATRHITTRTGDIADETYCLR